MPLNISTDRGQTVVDPAALASGTVVKVHNSVPLPYKRALLGLTVPAANRLSMTSVANVVAGMVAAGTNIPGGATVSAISGNTLTLSANVTGTVASGASITFSTTKTTTAQTAAGTNLAVPTAGLSAGMTIAGTNIAGGATIQAIVDANNLTMSAAVTGTVASSATITFALPAALTTSAATTTTSTAPLGLRVVAADPDGLLGPSYSNTVGAIVYNEKMTTFTDLARAVARGWALVPMANITPAAPTYL